MGLGLLSAEAQGYTYTYNEIELGEFGKGFQELESKMELWFGWLRAVAQGYSCSCGSMEWTAARGGARLQLQL